MEINGVEIEDNFAEAFGIQTSRILITAATKKLAKVAAVEATGYGTSVIGCPAEAGIDCYVPPQETPDGRPGYIIMLRINERSETSHKGQNGRVLIVGGSADYSGAPALAASASMGSGADITVVASPKAVSDVIRSYSPDTIVRTLSNTVSNDFVNLEDLDELLNLSKNADSLVIGCGIGRADETGDALNELIPKVQKPVVIDADALKLIDINTIVESVQNGLDVVVTPHGIQLGASGSKSAPETISDIYIPFTRFHNP